VNRVGVDGNGYRYSGDSRIIDPLGRIVNSRSHAEAILTGVFSAATLKDYRSEFPAWMDADGDMVAGKTP
jgi:predicted amidohydrolase